MEDMQVDHIISRYKKGTDDLENFNPACRMCNFRKGVYTIEQFRREIQDQAETAMKTFGNRMSSVYGAPADGLSQWNTTKEILATISDD